MDSGNEPDRAAGGPASADKLRARIDSGDAGDKVPFPDPAAAPLGTDEEAAGTPPSPEHLDIAFAQEMRRTVRHEREWARWIPSLLATVAFIAVVAIILTALSA